MIPINTLREVEKILFPEINKCISEFNVSKKEKGHTLSATIEEKVSEVLISHGYPITFERDKNGKKKARANSDLLFDGYKVNVKFGMSNNVKFGQPNITALGKLIKDFKDTECDAYYLLKIKRTGEELSIVFVDILNHPQLLTFNSGPGQMMLREEAFYQTEGLYDRYLTKIEKHTFMLNLYIKETDRHIRLRIRQNEAKRREIEEINS